MDARRVGLAAVCFVLALLSVFLARPVLGQTTTSTSTSTTTTTVTTTSTTTVPVTTTTTTTLPPGAGRVTCVVESDSVYVNGPYHVLGHCIMSPGYAEGGDGFSVANTVKDAGKALCNSPQRVPVVVLVEAAHPAPATTNWLLFDYEHGTRKIRAFDPKLGTEVVAGTDLSAYTIRFRADCR